MELVMKIFFQLLAVLFVFASSTSFAENYKCTPEKARGSSFVKKNMLQPFYFNNDEKQFKFEKFKLEKMQGGPTGSDLLNAWLTIKNPFLENKDFQNAAGNRGVVSSGVRPVQSGTKLKDVKSLFLKLKVFSSNMSFNLEVEQDWGFIRGKCVKTEEIPGLEMANKESEENNLVATTKNGSNRGSNLNLEKNFLSKDELKELSRINKNTSNSFEFSKWYLDHYSSKTKNWFKKYGKTKPVNTITGPPRCLTAHRYFYGSTSFKYEQERKLKNSVRSKMSGFPEQVIEYCATPTYVIKSGKMTNHPLNKKYYTREVSTLILRDLKTMNVAPVRVIIETDYISDRSGGNVYNENLDKVCELRFTGGSKAIIKCKNFGTIPAKFTVTNLFKGEYKLFGKNDRFEIFATNLNMVDAKKKYKKFFQ